MLYDRRTVLLGICLLGVLTLASCENTLVKEAASINLCNEDLQVLGINVGKDTLVDVQNNFGKAEPMHRSEHDDARICYLVDDGVVIYEAGALGGWKTITGFHILRPESEIDISRCVTHSGQSILRSVVPVISFMDTPQTVIARYGEPNSKIKDGLSYRQISKLPMTTAELDRARKQWPQIKNDEAYWDVTCSAEFHFKDGRLISAHFQRLESY